MDAVEKMNLYSSLVYVFIAIAAIGFALAVLFFFLFDIRDVYALMTGKAKRDAIERMNEQNSQTGRLRAVTGNVRDSAAPAVRPPLSAVTEDVTATGTAVAPPNETTVLGGAAETSVLAGRSPEETTVLTGPPQEPAYVPPTISFVVTESTLVIHTDEMI